MTIAHARINAMTKTVRRLFNYFRPEHYQLALSIDPEKMRLSGTVIVKGQKIGRPSHRLTFHQKELKIQSATIIRHEKTVEVEIPIDRINHHRGYDEFRIHTKDLLYPGHYTITLHYTAKITQPMHGIYPCDFEYKSRPKKLIATQFESHHAREAFPCIDEPEAKATFELTLHTPPNQTTISNTPIRLKKTTPSGDITTFAITPKMSTYLLAFVFGELTCLEATTTTGVKVRTYATPENTPHTKFALEVAVKCLEFFDTYFAIPYPLAKCDLVALPDFASGAMENWGCITFREQTLLVDPSNTSLPVKQFVAMVVAHELAHQWFGNLVTMRWWTDLWLNEGFASWIEYLAVNACFPEWELWTQFIVDEQERALSLDALENTHPIEVPIHHPEEISSIFDIISYSKGSSIIHMLHNYLGAEVFRDGLRHYLKQHAYSNTDTVDLWKALEDVSKKPVRQFMHTWTSCPGFPLISLKPDTTHNNLHISQERFSYTRPKVDSKSKVNDTSTLWSVPLLASKSLPDTILTKKSEIYTTKNSQQPLLLNTNGAGFYRTHYDDPELWSHVIDNFKDKTVPIEGQLRILTDSLEVAKANFGSSLNFLSLIKDNDEEENAFIWDVMAGGLMAIRSVMDDEELREAMKPFGRQLIAKQLTRLGWEAKNNHETHFDTLLRPVILSIASVSNEKSVVEEALKRFSQLKKSEDVDPNLRGVIYSTAAREGDHKTFDKLLNLYTTSTNSEEKITLCAALTGFRQLPLIKRSLELIISDAVRMQDVAYWVGYSFSNRFAKAETWKWMVEHWEWLEENLSADLSFYLFPVYAARAFTDAKLLPIYKKFFTAHMRPSIKRSVAQGIEIIEWQSNWRKRDLPALKQFFKD